MTPNTTATSPATEISPEQLNDLLHSKGIDPEYVLVLRNQVGKKKSQLKLRERLPSLAAEDPDIYNAYQSTQTEKTGQAMRKAHYVASFIGNNSPGTAVFIGLYKNHGDGQLPTCQYQYRQKLESLGAGEFGERDLWFDLKLMTDFYPELKGRLIVEWPVPGISWYLWANSKRFRGHIREQSIFDDEMLPWAEFVLTGDELQESLPTKWQTELKNCRGIYFIFDVSDGKGYVGSACGKDNIFGRWESYRTGDGGNEGLRGRDRKNFRYSILERVPSGTPCRKVQRLEGTWKKRLHTREFGFNKN